jgi:serine/threonine-protein kinase
MRDDLVRAASGRAVRATPLLPAAEATQVMAPVAATTVLRHDPQRVAERRSGRGWGYFALALAAIAVFGLTAWLVAKALDTGKQTVSVPEVVGLTQQKAEDAIRAADLEVGTIDQQPDPAGKVKKGIVLSQDPGASEAAETGTKVNLVVSTGAEKVDVPRLDGLSLKDATKALEDARLRLGEVTAEEKSGAAPDEVLRSDPVAGTSVAVNSKVNLVVAAKELTVPNVVGKTEEEALRALDDAGFFKHRTSEEFSDKPKGTVVKQTPKGDSKAPADTTVVLVISSGPSPTPEPPTPPPTTPPPTTAPPPTPA